MTTRSGKATKRRKGGTSVKERVRAHRRKLRAQGLRPIQIWVPDTNSPAFRAEARRQARLAAASPHDAEDQAFVDSISFINFR
ncbi:MAG: DUF3018 family protein [Alphaproteobacteria bacterium]|nr:DUF3018 family protein [Alphaproteobacteria bacterium]